MRAKAAAAARSMASLMRGVDYDAGFPLSALDLLTGTGQQATAEDVARALNELTTAVHVMRSQANIDGFVSRENKKHVGYMQTMATVVEQQAAVCQPKERRAILSQLRLAQDWLASVVS